MTADTQPHVQVIQQRFGPFAEENIGDTNDTVVSNVTEKQHPFTEEKD